MLILNSRKVIYIHIHKTGGETVEHLLGKLRAWNDIILDDASAMSREFTRQFRLDKHSTALAVANLLGLEAWNSYFSWATVRNPYERIASAYGYVTAGAEPHLSTIGFPLSGSYEAQRNWVESSDYPLRHQWAYPGVRAYLATRGSKSPFSDFLRHPLLKIAPAFRSQFSRLRNAKGDALLVKQVIKLELLPSLWPQLCSEMRVPPPELLVRNATPTRWKRSVEDLFTDPSDLELVNTIFADDFRWFNYETIGKNSARDAVDVADSDIEA